MKRMRPLVKAMREWLPRAPRWTAVLLGGVMAVDAAHFVFRLGVEAPAVADPRQGTSRPSTSKLAALDPQQIAGAHLFGVEPVAAQPGADSAPETHLALSGVIATSDPNDGYAMLGEQGQPTRLYHAGAALAQAGGGRLDQVFTDRVVLDFGGRRETLSLPRQQLDTSAAVRVPRFDTPAAAATAVLISQREEPPSAAEGWFSNLYAERYTAEGRTRLRLHPAKHFQRRYGLRDGDTLTAVNGVPVGDDDAVDSSLRAGGKTVALTLTRNGVEETVRIPIEQ
jgi:general secretion pathway protein C